MESTGDRFNDLKKVGSGTYGVVYSGYDTQLQRDVAIKKVKLELEEEGIPSTTLRELSLLNDLKHPNIVELLDIIWEENNILLVFELCKMDMKQYVYDQNKGRLDAKKVKKFMKDLLESILFWHENATFHRDLKPNNLLVDNEGTLKLADFGLARAFNLPMKDYTHEVVTLWYRAPEILLGDNSYSLPIDIWACGAIFYEFAHKKPFFYGHSEIDVIFKIFEIWGTPTNAEWEGVEKLRFYKAKFPKFKGKPIDSKMWPYFDDVAIDLFKKMIALSPQERISAKEALQHEYFK